MDHNLLKNLKNLMKHLNILYDIKIIADKEMMDINLRRVNGKKKVSCIPNNSTCGISEVSIHLAYKMKLLL